MRFLLQILSLLLLLINKLSHHTANQADYDGKSKTKFSDAFSKVEELVEQLELVGYILEDTEDWKKLKTVEQELYPDSNIKELKLREIRDFYESSKFKLESLRDELQFITNEVKFYGIIQSKREADEKAPSNS